MSLRDIPEGITVISLFDGIACGLQALKESGFKIKAYYASEVDKHAIKIAKKNHPEIIHVGDVRNIRITGKIKFDLLIGGSPCQGFSFAGKGLNFNDPRSALFFEYIRIKNDLQKYFPEIKCMLENVRMKKEWAAIISEHFGAMPIIINSALVSAQNRIRFYWINWDLNQPKDMGIVLYDILESVVDSRYYLSKVALARLNNIVQRAIDTKSGYRSGLVAIDSKANTIDASYFKGPDGKRSIIKTRRIGSISFQKNGNIIAAQRHFVYNEGDLAIRMLTPIECERLQGLPDNYTEGISQTQRYKALGNGWQLDTIKHIFKSL